MRTRSLILLVLLATLSGCIVTYRDFPIVNPLPSPYEPAAPPRCRQTVKFLGGLAKQSAWELRLSVALQEALKNYGGCSSSSPVDYNSKGAETEVVVSVLGKKSYPWYEKFPGWGFLVSSGLFPFYSGQSGVELIYSFYDRKDALKKTYQYKITSKEFAGYCCFYSPGLTSSPIISKMLYVRQLRNLSWMPNEMGIWEQRIDSLDKSQSSRRLRRRPSSAVRFPGNCRLHRRSSRDN